MNIDIVTHNAITIERPAEVVWPYILDIEAWKHDSVLRHVRGPVGECGEVFSAHAPGSNQISYFVENVEIVAARRRTIKLLLPDGRLLGFSSWSLSEHATGTTLAYDVYAGYPAPTEPGSDDVKNRELVEVERARFQAELLTLKSILETGDR